MAEPEVDDPCKRFEACMVLSGVGDGKLPGGANPGGGDGAGGHRKSRCEPQGVDGER